MRRSDPDRPRWSKHLTILPLPTPGGAPNAEPPGPRVVIVPLDEPKKRALTRPLPVIGTRPRLGAHEPVPAKRVQLFDQDSPWVPAPAEPALPAPPPAPASLNEPAERRQVTHAGETVLRTGMTTLTRLACPTCHHPARVDMADLMSGRLYLSCDRCERMWQDRVRVDAPDPSAQMRG